MLRSVGAIVAGFVIIAALSFGADAVMRQIMPTAFVDGHAGSTAMLLLIMGYVALFAVFGCYLTARMAPNRPMMHALILGVLGLCFNIAGSVAMWDTAPAWYHIASLLLVMPYAWIGGRLREAELSRGATAMAAA